ncbi:MAG: hypothetical protein KGZ92_03360 [Firmicutes bacterium]|nr:hypothetical protein [Dethiobacter sp.]MBS3888327.1 hypothetical protein [Bacillota bacterium]MBS4055421.1 hypothetical protein [Thermaerobacter sp.]
MRLETTLEQLQRYGQRFDWEFIPATVGFALPCAVMPDVTSQTDVQGSQGALAGVSYVAATAVFLGAAGLVNYPFSMRGLVCALSLEGWIRHFGLVSPLTAFCLVFLLRARLSRRGYVLTRRAALIGSALLAVPALCVIIYGERLHWYLLPLGPFALPATLLLGAVTVAAFVGALVSVCVFYALKR